MANDDRGFRVLAVVLLMSCASAVAGQSPASVQSVVGARPVGGVPADVYRVQGAAFAGPTRVFVADQELRLLLVDVGRAVVSRVVGGRGDGPGEYRNISTIIPWRGGVLVADLALRRLTVLDSAGTVQGTASLTRDGRLIEPVGALRDGRVVVVSRRRTQVPRQSEFVVDSVDVGLWSVGQSAVQWIGAEARENRAVAVDQGGVTEYAVPFAGRALMVAGDRHVVLTRPDAGGVVALAADGAATVIASPRSVNSTLRREEVSRYRDSLLGAIRRSPVRVKDAESRVERTFGPDFPLHVAAWSVTRMVADGSRVWICECGAAAERERTWREVTLLDRQEGRRVAVGSHEEILVILEGVALLSRVDADGVAEIILARL